MQIPKLIHYCWFGNAPKPDVFNKCLESWEKFLPEYEIKEWNEDNIDLSFSPFAQKAYQAKKWAFVSDIVRLKVLYDYGGIYMDTDVELYSSFDNYIDNDAFFFFHNHHQINTGVGFGSVKNDYLVKQMLEIYNELEFQENNLNSFACPISNTNAIVKQIKEFIPNNTNQQIGRYTFVCFDDYCRIAHHYGEFSWKTEEQRKALKYSKKNHKHWWIRKKLRNPNIFKFFQNHEFVLLEKLYSFLVYDFIDYGCIYWLVRVWSKFTHSFFKN